MRNQRDRTARRRVWAGAPRHLQLEEEHIMDGRSALQARALSKRYGRRSVLDGVDFHVDRGEAVAIIGENGAGKTTLLKLCAGLLAPDAGSVRRAGRIGYCPQEPGVVDLLTAEQHVLLFGAA